MSISTRSGDSGATNLRYNRRISKCHPRIEACGAVDELTSALGLARASTGKPLLRNRLEAVQHDLLLLMSELATANEDWPQHQQDGQGCIAPPLVEQLDKWIQELEHQLGSFKDWAIPGLNPQAAALDMARAICRRAERRVCALHEAGQLRNSDILAYLNRLSDLLWLLARWAEEPAPQPPSASNQS